MGNITVTAGDGRTVPIHSSVATAPGGRLLLLQPDDELEIEECLAVAQRGLRNGDLVRVASPRTRLAGERLSPASAQTTGASTATRASASERAD